MKNSLIIATALLLLLTPKAAFAQTTFDLKPASNQYTASGKITISRNTQGQFAYTATVQNLPSTLPGGGTYYIFWATLPDGRADNLGTISNNSEIRGNLTSRVSQFFITSEKQRFPEFVEGPRIGQTDTIPETAFNNLASTQPSPSRSPQGGLVVITGNGGNNTSTSSAGRPTASPETGLGGATLFAWSLYGMMATSAVGLYVTHRKQTTKRK